MKQTQQSGFTLIELVMVIVILGILAATALPRFVDMSTQARAAAVQGVAGAVSSGFAVNYAARVAGNGNAQTISGNVPVNAAAGSVMTGGSVPSGYTVTAAASTVACGTTAGAAISLTVTNGTETAPATLICTG